MCAGGQAAGGARAKARGPELVAHCEADCRQVKQELPTQVKGPERRSHECQLSEGLLESSKLLHEQSDMPFFLLVTEFSFCKRRRFLQYFVQYIVPWYIQFLVVDFPAGGATN